MAVVRKNSLWIEWSGIFFSASQGSHACAQSVLMPVVLTEPAGNEAIEVVRNQSRVGERLQMTAQYKMNGDETGDP